MKRTKSMTTLLIFAAAMMIVLVTAPTGSASNPPPEGAHFQGPAVRGQFVFENDGNGGLLASFNGTCGAGDIFMERNSFPNFDFPGDVSEENLLENVIDYFLMSPFTMDCEPNLNGKTPDGLLTIQVKSYIDNETAIVVDVIMLWVVPQ